MMQKATDMESCKRIAKVFLDMDIESDPYYGDFIIHHPYFSSSIVMNMSGDLCNIIKDPSALVLAKQQFRERIDKANSYQYFLEILNKPYLLAFLKYTHSYLSIEDLSEYLSEAWQRVEFPNHDATFTKPQALTLFRQCDPSIMMDEEEQQMLKDRPDRFSVYRCVKKGYGHKGLSWTLSKDVAEWFSLRFSDHGMVYKAEIQKEDVFAVFLNRGEQEIVLNYKKLEKVRALKQSRRHDDLMR